MHKLSELNNNIELVINKNTIDEINYYYKVNHNHLNNIDEFDEYILDNINKLKSGKTEIEKQLELGKGLQSGVLFECVIIQSLADYLGLDKYMIADNINERYIYYNEYSDIKLIQMGSPTETDLSYIEERIEHLIEIKDIPALLSDKDLLYDENGKVVIPKNMDECFRNILLTFNEDNSIIDMMGNNYSFSYKDDEYLPLLKERYKRKNIEYILTSNEDKLVFIDIDDLDKKVDDEYIISLDGSEIRSVGKNSRIKPFAPLYLDNVIKDYNILEKENVLYIDKDNKKIIGPVKGRGKSYFTRFKINNCFYVKCDNLIEEESRYIIDKKDIRQSKSGVSFHISLNN